jgi:hypothetical protein
MAYQVKQRTKPPFINMTELLDDITNRSNPLVCRGWWCEKKVCMVGCWYGSLNG